MCGDGQCMARLWRCDGEKDCHDGSDEMDCDSTTCDPDAELRCGNGQCIPITWVCDGTNDCNDAADEATCRPKNLCSHSEYRCDDNSCIDKALVCNREKDCADGSDEKNCTYVPCRKGQMQCKDGNCIYDFEWCDGHVDCRNGEDELNCTANECEAEKYLCSFNKRCIPRSWLCDGDNDCGDGEDETQENCLVSPSRTPPNCSEFLCRGTSKCISWSQVCDGHRDCLFGTDEGGLCSEACYGGRGRCSQMCQKTPQGSKCSCYSGYTLARDNVTCVDVDECDVPGSCSQFCKNTEGGFKCFCAEGYAMDGHGKCKATEGGSATLLYLLPDQVVGIDLQTHSRRVYINESIYVADMRALDYDASQGIIFVADWIKKTIKSYNPRTNEKETLFTARYNLKFLRWDWIHKNFYYASYNGNMVVCNSKGIYCNTVISNAAIVINGFDISPHKSLMFWSVWRNSPRRNSGMIERAELDGSHRIAIVNEGLEWPSSVTVDHLMHMVYWIDLKLRVMECSDFHGLKRRVVVPADSSSYPAAMTMFEDFVYWSDWVTTNIKRCDKHSGLNCTDVYEKQGKSDALAILHVAQQPKGENRCFHNECPQLCVPTRSSYVCRCDDDYNLVDGACEIKSQTKESSDSHTRRNRFKPRVEVKKTEKGTVMISVQD